MIVWEVLLSSHLLTRLWIVYRQEERIEAGEKVSEIDWDVTYFAMEMIVLTRI